VSFPVRLLVLNCHEPWIYQLRVLDAALDLVVDLPGRNVAGWDERMRPVPPNARLLSLADAVAAAPEQWGAVICHNISDLIATAPIDAPKLLVLHDTLDGRMAQQGAEFEKDAMIGMLAQYLEFLGAHAVAVTAAKGESWGVAGTPLQCFADPADYSEATYATEAGLRVANDVTSKRVFLAWDFHEEAFHGLPVTLVGRNPHLGVDAARDWNDLKRYFASHRFFVHTADPRYEDGFNMAMVEAMAAGLPVISNAHPTSPITHGVDGFLAATPAEARAHAVALLEDANLARAMGSAARRTAVARFGPGLFRDGARAAIAHAREKYGRRPARQAP
jgi:glycosyltransferase involved in cell wall biosynthesis